MGKKQRVNQTFGLSCQGSAALHAKVQKYETAEIGHIFSFPVAQQTWPLALQWWAICGFTWSSEESDAFFSHMHSS